MARACPQPSELVAECKRVARASERYRALPERPQRAADARSRARAAGGGESWGLLGAFWGAFGISWGSFGELFAPFGGSWKGLGSLKAALNDVLRVVSASSPWVLKGTLKDSFKFLKISLRVLKDF